MSNCCRLYEYKSDDIATRHCFMFHAVDTPTICVHCCSFKNKSLFRFVLSFLKDPDLYTRAFKKIRSFHLVTIVYFSSNKITMELLNQIQLKTLMKDGIRKPWKITTKYYTFICLCKSLCFCIPFINNFIWY